MTNWLAAVKYFHQVLLTWPISNKWCKKYKLPAALNLFLVKPKKITYRLSTMERIYIAQSKSCVYNIDIDINIIIIHSRCASSIGKVGGLQLVKLFGCGLSLTRTQFAKVLGFELAQKRFDRDNYIYVNLTNVPKGKTRK